MVATTDRADDARIEAVRDQGAEVLIVEQDSSGRVDLDRLLPRLRCRDIHSLLIEGGATVITAALRAHLVDRLVVCIAPKLLGQGIEAVGDLNITSMDEALQFERVTYSSLGDDIILDGRLARERVPSA
jgi:riboflavin biosynthesis pyrimidine reductase